MQMRLFNVERIYTLLFLKLLIILVCLIVKFILFWVSVIEMIMLNNTGETATMQAVGGRACSSATAGVSPSAFPCLNRNNSINSFNELSTANKKTSYALELNCFSFIQQVGFNNVGFLTLTFSDNIQDREEAQRRFNSLRTNFLSKLFGRYIRVMERCKSGRIHYHLLVDCGGDIRRGIDFQALMRGDYRSACPFLRELWAILRSELPKYGFGRSELLPIKSNKKGISRYISKYISKHIKERKPEDKGARLCQYSLFDVFKICSTRFAFWSDGYKEFIRKLQLFIKVVLSYFSSNYKSSPPSDIEEDIDNFIKKYMGNKWIFNNAQIIYFIDEVLSIYGERTIHYFIKKQIIKKQMKEIKSYLPSFFVNSDDMKGFEYVSNAR